jgi:TAG lipase/steryl ester hydrolase/phospholipase A2/LPA acyltransferase
MKIISKLKIVNPHIIPFLDTSPVQSFFKKAVYQSAFLVHSEIQHRLNQLLEIGFTSRLIFKLYSILSQKYFGDITIVPSLPAKHYLWLVSNPSAQLTTEFTFYGEKATWPRKN